MLADEFMSLSIKIFDILGDETDFNLSDKDIPLEDGGYFFAIGTTYNLDLSKPISDDSDYNATTYFEKRIELAKKHPFISTHTFNRLIDLLDNYPYTIRGSLRLNAE